MDDREIARRALALQKSAREYRMMDLPGYAEWSERKIAEGESGALIAHLDATSMYLMPEDLDTVSESDFEELLTGLKAELE